MTVLDVRTEIGTYNNLLNHFIKTFDLQIFNLKYLDDYKLKDLRDYHQIKPELYELLISMSNEITLYHNDYYNWKSVNSIAVKIGVEEEQLLQYLNDNKVILFPPTYEFNQPLSYPDLRNFEGQKFSQNTEMKKISSYQILKNLQIIRRFELIRSEMI